MQAAETLRGTRAISLLVLLVPLIGYAHSNPLQYLPNIPGYVPVYIRYGDEPLEEINPDLAEAFGETSNSAKKIDHTFAHESDNFQDEDLDSLLEESNTQHVYPLHARAAESRSFSVNDEEPGNPTKPKLLTIYELPNENRPRRRYRGRNRMKSIEPPALKVSPLSDTEKEELEKLAIEVEKEETKPNELYVPNPRYPELPSERPHNRHKAHNYVAPMKVQNPFDEFSNLPELPRITDLSKSSNDHRTATSQARKRDPPIKEQRPATILANVDKVSPIDLPDKSETSEEKPLIKKPDLPEIPQVADVSKSLNNRNIAASEADKKQPPIKELRPVSSNVDNDSIIDLLDDSKTNKDNTPETGKEESSIKETGRSKISKPSNDQNIATSEADKMESPIKVQRSSTILSNVDKLSPIDLPESETSKDNKTKDPTE